MYKFHTRMCAIQQEIVFSATTRHIVGLLWLCRVYNSIQVQQQHLAAAAAERGAKIERNIVVLVARYHHACNL